MQSMRTIAKQNIVPTNPTLLGCSHLCPYIFLDLHPTFTDSGPAVMGFRPIRCFPVGTNHHSLRVCGSPPYLGALKFGAPSSCMRTQSRPQGRSQERSAARTKVDMQHLGTFKHVMVCGVRTLYLSCVFGVQAWHASTGPAASVHVCGLATQLTTATPQCRANK
jgi:hypothetical protein